MTDFAAVHKEAVEAGLAAGKAAVPVPMVVTPGMILVNGAPVLDRDYFVPDGACGFAWVVVKPARGPFVKWAKANLRTHHEYGGGEMVYWVGEFNQSMARKEAFAHAYAAVLVKHGINAFARARMD